MSLADLRKTAPPADEPGGVATSVTPSGLEIYYQASPKRLYRVADPMLSEWKEVPSVSTVLDVLEKGGLSWWGMKVGIAGVIELANAFVDQPDYDSEYADDFVAGRTVDEFVDLLKANKLTVNHVKSQAADRGTNVHTAFEAYAETGVIPDPQFYPENERGYVEGVVQFIKDANPIIEHSELMVASAADGFAGRFDAVAVISGDVVTKTYPKKKPIRERVSGRWLLDLKTSKDVYPSYKIQLAAYEAAMTECGYGEVDNLGVVRVTSDGRYEVVESDASYTDFLNVLDTYRSVKRLK